MLSGNLASIGVGGIIASVSSFLVGCRTMLSVLYKVDTDDHSGQKITIGRVHVQSMFKHTTRALQMRLKCPTKT